MKAKEPSFLLLALVAVLHWFAAVAEKKEACTEQVRLLRHRAKLA